jgi:cyclic-di-GMP-binding biofilm dispersal mediator protein
VKRDLADSSIVLAGATGGLGSAIGARLATDGARLVLFGRNAARLTSIGLPGVQVAGDLRDRAACERAVEAAVEAYGRIDGLVNAAGVVAFGDVEGLTDGVVEELVEANLLGPLRLVRAALPRLEPGGFIANVSAVVAEHPTAGMALYSATKAALTAFDRALAREARRRRIDVIDLRPPHTETGLASRPIAGTAPRLAEGLAPDAVAERIVEAIRAGVREVASEEFSSARPAGTSTAERP